MQVEQPPLEETKARWSKTTTSRAGYLWIESNFLQHTVAKTKDANKLVVFIDRTTQRADRNSNRTLIGSLYNCLSQQLVEKGVFSLLYTPSGKEFSENDKALNTLDLQTEKLVDLLEIFFEEFGVFDDITLIGLCDGAHIAVSVLAKTRIKKFKIDRLVLLSPPTYPERIDQVPFGPEFEDRLASFEKFKSSPIFEKLKRFCSLGRDLMLGFPGDEGSSVPTEVQAHFFGLNPKERNLQRRVNANKRGVFRTLKITKGLQKSDNDEIVKMANEMINFICFDDEY